MQQNKKTEPKRSSTSSRTRRQQKRKKAPPKLKKEKKFQFSGNRTNQEKNVISNYRRASLWWSRKTGIEWLAIGGSDLSLSLYIKGCELSSGWLVMSTCGWVVGCLLACLFVWINERANAVGHHSFDSLFLFGRTQERRFLLKKSSKTFEFLVPQQQQCLIIFFFFHHSEILINYLHRHLNCVRSDLF